MGYAAPCFSGRGFRFWSSIAHLREKRQPVGVGRETPRQLKGSAPTRQRARWLRSDHIKGHAARDRAFMGRCPILQNLLCFRYPVVTNETVTG